MALSLDAIHKPLNDFFIEKFRTDASSPVFFRFDKFGSSISEEDFSSPALAIENFSYLVNRIPTEEADGLHVFVSPNPIDELYFYQLLTPCLPHVPPDASDVTKDSIIGSFSRIKADALRVWESTKLVSVTGLMVEYRPSTAFPEKWYDKSSPEWKTETFEISETTTAPAADNPKFQLWTLKANDAVMQKALGLNEAKAVEPTKMYKNIRGVQVDSQAMMLRRTEAMEIARRDVRTGTPQAMLRRTEAMETTRAARPLMAEGAIRPRRPDIGNEMEDVNLKTFAMHDVYLRDRRALNIRKRLAVDDYVGTFVPRQPVNTNKIRISFDFRIVDIRRPWCKSALINDKSWFIPHAERGQLTSKEQTAVKLRAMPVGFVAVKKLSIEATWSAVDIERSTKATDFSPFKVSSQIINNKLSHEGIQIVGWLLEKMPELPPVSDPALGSQPQSTLTFKAPMPSWITANQPFNIVVEGSPNIVKVDLTLDAKLLTTITSRKPIRFPMGYQLAERSEPYSGSHRL